MTVSTAPIRIKYVGDGVSTSFPINYPFFATTDLLVLLGDAVITSGYSTTGGNGNTGTLVMASAPLTSIPLQVILNNPVTQIVALVDGTAFPSATLNQVNDRAVQIDLRTRDLIGRCIRAPDGDVTPIMALPAAAARVSTFLGFDTNGNLSLGQTLPAGTLSQSSIGFFLTPQTAAESAAGVVPVNLGYDRPYIERQGAVADGGTDALASINKAISVNSRRVRSYDGPFKVSAAPTNPNGIQFEGVGAWLLPTAFTFPQQLNTYADLNKYMIGREYLYRVDLALSVSNLGSRNMGVFLYGDSTIVGSAIVNAANLLQNYIPRIGNRKGLACGLTVTNRGASGTDVSSLNVIPDLSTTTDFAIIKYGINDGLNPAGTRLNTFSSTLRSKLSAIRGSTNGDLPHLAILLVGPNCTGSDTDGRNEQWYEQLRGVYVQAARDFNCAYFDTYAFLKDCRPAANNWMDANTIGAQSNVPIHPNDFMQQWIWGNIMDFIFPQTAMEPYRGNYFQNLPQLVKKFTLANIPNDFDFGITMSRALVADSWPVDGMVITDKQVNGPTVQTLIPTTPGVQIYQRQGNTVAFGIWYAEDTATPTLLNSWVAFAAGQDVKAIKGGKIVCVTGLLKSGTTTNGTTLCVLPAGFRPRTTYWFTCPTSGPGTAQISVDSSGNVVGQAGLNATFTAVSLSFEAVN